TAQNTIQAAQIYLNRPDLSEASLKDYQVAINQLPLAHSNLGGAWGIITQTEHHLGVANLNSLPDMRGKTLTDLLTHNCSAPLVCPVCPVREAERDNLAQKYTK